MIYEAKIKQANAVRMCTEYKQLHLLFLASGEEMQSYSGMASYTILCNIMCNIICKNYLGISAMLKMYGFYHIT